MGIAVVDILSKDTVVINHGKIGELQSRKIVQNLARRMNPVSIETKPGHSNRQRKVKVTVGSPESLESSSTSISRPQGI